MSETRIVIPERGYFSLPRNAMQDERLSLEARGMLALMLSLPADWDYTASGLAIKAHTGRDKTRRILRELEQVGYLVREQTHDSGGQFSGNVYVLRETPSTEQNPPLTENPSTAEPSTAKPSTDFKAEQIIEEKIIDINNPPYNPPKGDGERKAKRREKSAPRWKPERFEGFWEYYPRSEARQAAVRAWDRLKPSDELIATIGRALEKLKATEDWQRGIGIPYAATFLNGQRWEDAEGKKIAPKGNAPARRLEPPPDDGGGGWTWVE